MQNDIQRFSYVKYDKKATDEQAKFKEVFEELDQLVQQLDGGRAQSLVFTKLEEAYMWVGKAIRDSQISRTGKIEEQPERGNG